MPITLEIRRELVEGLIPLYLHFAWRHLRQGVPFDEALNVHADIYRFTSLYDGKVIPYNAPPGWRDEKWESLLRNLRLVFDPHAAEPTSEAFEREGYEVFRSVLEAAFARGVAQWPRIEDRPFGFFSYNITEARQPPIPAIGLHMSNPFAPASPFADPQERTRELRRLVADVKRNHPDITYMMSGSWLNSFQPFLDLLPPEWAASATLFTGLFPGKGAWGQFFDRRGGFHRKNAEHLRRTGTFPYPPMVCECRIDTLSAYLGEASSPLKPVPPSSEKQAPEVRD